MKQTFSVIKNYFCLHWISAIMIKSFNCLLFARGGKKLVAPGSWKMAKHTLKIFPCEHANIMQLSNIMHEKVNFNLSVFRKSYGSVVCASALKSKNVWISYSCFSVKVWRLLCYLLKKCCKINFPLNLPCPSYAFCIIYLKKYSFELVYFVLHYWHAKFLNYMFSVESISEISLQKMTCLR